MNHGLRFSSAYKISIAVTANNPKALRADNGGLFSETEIVKQSDLRTGYSDRMPFPTSGCQRMLRKKQSTAIFLQNFPRAPFY